VLTTLVRSLLLHVHLSSPNLKRFFFLSFFPYSERLRGSRSISWACYLSVPHKIFSYPRLVLFSLERPNPQNKNPPLGGSRLSLVHEHSGRIIPPEFILLTLKPFSRRPTERRYDAHPSPALHDYFSSPPHYRAAIRGLAGGVFFCLEAPSILRFGPIITTLIKIFFLVCPFFSDLVPPAPAGPIPRSMQAGPLPPFILFFFPKAIQPKKIQDSG